MESFRIWLITFLTEKGIFEDIDDSLGEDFEKVGLFGFTHESLIDEICSSSNRDEIKKQLIWLDFKNANANILDYYNGLKSTYLEYLKKEFSDYVTV